MNERKHELMDYVLYDYHYIQRHLTEMAEKGWRLEKIGTFGIWRYRRAEPARVRYEVTYAPSASAYNSRPTQAEEALSDLCADAGWVKVGSVAQLHIYCNEDPDATPLETDEPARIRILKKTMIRHFVPQNLLMAALFLMQFFMHWHNARRWPVNTLSSPLMVGTLILMLCTVLMYLGIIAGYFHWVRRAEQAAESGAPIPESVFYRRFRFILWVALAGYLVTMLLTMGLEIIGITLAIAAVSIGVTGVTLHCCKKLGAPKWVNIAVPFVCCMLALGLTTPLIFGILDTASLSDEPEVPADLPLYLTDLLDSESEPITIAYEESDSFLVSKTHLWQESGDSNHEISYTIVDADLGFVYDRCLYELEQNFIQSSYYLSNGIINTNQCDLWDAEYVRQAPGDFNDRWLICWDGRIVSLRTSWPLTDEQIAAIATALKP